MTPSHPSAHARSQGFGSSSSGHLREWQSERHAAQQRATLVERQARHVSAIEPQNVEHVVVRLAEGAPPPGGFAVEDDVVDRQVGDGLDHGRMRAVERQPVPRQQANVGAVLERQQPNAVELALEDPLGPGEPVLRERRRHRFEPVGKRVINLQRQTVSTPTHH